MMRRTVYSALGAVCAAAVAFAVTLTIAPYPVADYAAVRAGWRASDAWLLDRHGEPLSRVRIDRQRRRGDWVTTAEVSLALLAATAGD